MRYHTKHFTCYFYRPLRVDIPRMAITTSSLRISREPLEMKYIEVRTSPLCTNVSPGGAWVVLNFILNALKERWNCFLLFIRRRCMINLWQLNYYILLPGWHDAMTMCFFNKFEYVKYGKSEMIVKKTYISSVYVSK